MKFFLERKAVAWLLVIWIIGLGVFSLITIPKDIQPKLELSFQTVSTFLPGASPNDTETLITKPLEKAIAPLSNIKKMTSSSGPGMSSILIEFESGIDLNKSYQDLKDVIDKVKSDLPDGTIDPIVTKLESDNVPAVIFSIKGNKSILELSEEAEKIQEELEKISGVSRINLVGNQKKIIEVKIDKEKADNYGLNIQNISDIIKLSGPNVPIGTISSDHQNYAVRIDNQYLTIDDIRNLALFSLQTPERTIIYLSDIASISETIPQASVISKLSVDGDQAQTTVSIQIFKKDNTDSLKVVDAVKEAMEKYQQAKLPSDIAVTISNDNSEFIREDLGILTKNGIQTTILIIVVLFLALGFTEGLIAGASIPLSLLLSFIVIYFNGTNINTMTLFALVIALGLMVDNSIVIMEGIHENMKKGKSSEEAALASIETYKWPITAGTMTTIFAFFPMLLVSGIVGQFLRTLPITISIALLSSLAISLTIGPTITARLLKNVKTQNRKSLLDPFFNWAGDLFHNLIYSIIGKRSVKTLVILLTLILFAGSMALPLTGALKTEMFPKTDMNYFILHVETPKGLILDETAKVTEKIENDLYSIKEVKNFLSVSGSSSAQASTQLIDVGGSSDSNLANITVNLIPKEEREITSYDLAEDLRNNYRNFPDAKITIEELTEGPPGGAAITLKVIGEDLKTLEQIGTDIEKVIQGIEGTVDTQNSLESGSGLEEFRFKLDPQAIAYHGLSTLQVASLIRNSIQGIKSTEITLEEEDLDLIVKYDLPESNGKVEIDLSDIENISVASPLGYQVSLGELAEYEFTESPASIEREDQKRIVQISSSITNDANADEINAKIQTQLADYPLPEGYEISYAGDTQEIEESFQDLFRSMIVGIILIGFTLVLMFNSLKQPFIILLTLPLAIIGVFPGLMAIGLQLSFPAFLGIVALSGVVVNDAIVLIDKINNNRKAGIEFNEAIAEAAKSRLQPIIMTSITTIVGIFPLALTNEFWKGLSFALIFGLAAGTLLTLIVIPVIYYLFEYRKAKAL